ncbi:MAG: hypothetical protein DDT38_01507 [Firmicutes bacterium]|nr:hypothetical protein [candidate division NPL-UPA2 bacterium]
MHAVEILAEWGDFDLINVYFRQSKRVTDCKCGHSVAFGMEQMSRWILAVFLDFPSTNFYCTKLRMHNLVPRHKTLPS